MTATIELIDKRRFVNLLYATFAITDKFSHDANKITFRREDGFTLHIDFTVSTAYYGPERVPGAPERGDGKRRWATNLGFAELECLLLMFIDRRDEELRGLPLWEGIEIDGVRYVDEPPREGAAQ